MIRTTIKKKRGILTATAERAENKVFQKSSMHMVHILSGSKANFRHL